jgi:hypothetical protein
MALLRRAKVLLTWKEPWLFAARTRDRRGWLARGTLAAIIFALMLAANNLDRIRGRGGPRLATPGAILLSAFVGLFLTAMLDAPDLNREITISDDNINAVGVAGTHVSMSSWALGDVLWVRLIPPSELGRSFGAMEFFTRRYRVRLGVPASLSMSRIADVLHGQGMRVVLAGWQPVEAGTQPEAIGGTASGEPAPVAMPFATARIERLGEGEAGQILTPGRLRLSVLMALGPLVVLLVVGLGACGYVVYRAKFLNAAVSAADGLAAIGGMGLIMFGFWFTNRFGNLVPMRWLRAVARSKIEMRPNAVLDPRDPEAEFVEVIPRTNWEKSMTRQSIDTGLLKVDELSRSVLFEGDQARWRIPAASLISAEVESYRPASYVEGQAGGEVYHVTVIRANVGGEIWEAPVSKNHVELRPKTNRLREANAVALRDRIRAIMPLGARPA